MSGARGEPVGVVVAVWRYPVKSMRGESLDRAELTWNGLDGDRRHAFVLDGDRSRFPWLTGRRAAALLRYAPRYQDPANLRKSPLQVGLPEGGSLDLHSPELRQRLAAEAGGPLGLIQVGRGIFDSLPVSVMTTASNVNAIGAGNDHTLARTTGGGLLCWGRGANGQCMDSATFTPSGPQYLMPITATPTGITLFAAGGTHSCVYVPSSSVTYCAGTNEYGEIGSGTPSSLFRTSVPTPVEW